MIFVLGLNGKPTQAYEQKSFPARFRVVLSAGFYEECG